MSRQQGPCSRDSTKLRTIDWYKMVRHVNGVHVVDITPNRAINWYNVVHHVNKTDFFKNNIIY